METPKSSFVVRFSKSRPSLRSVCKKHIWTSPCVNVVSSVARTHITVVTIECSVLQLMVGNCLHSSMKLFVSLVIQHISSLSLQQPADEQLAHSTLPCSLLFIFPYLFFPLPVPMDELNPVPDDSPEDHGQAGQHAVCTSEASAPGVHRNLPAPPCTNSAAGEPGKPRGQPRSMGLLYEIDKNSMVPSSKLHLTVARDLFWTLSTAITMFSFSKVFREESRRQGARKLHQGLQSIATPTWRKWYGLAQAVVTWVVLVQFFYEIIEANKLGLFHDLVYFIDFVCMFAVVVTSEEGVYGLRAIQRACRIIGRRLEDIPVLVVTHVLIQDALEAIYRRAFSEREMKVPLVIREDTAADVLRFSAVAALVAVIQQSFECTLVLAFYKRRLHP